jgi:hypothetical protein
MPYCNLAIEAGLHTVLRYGRGAAFVDIDGDGWDDLFFADCDNRWHPDGYGVSMFFRNQGDGTFAPLSATDLGIADSDLVATWSGSFADYDNDGDPDLLLANGGYSAFSNVAFYENRMAEDGRFVAITEASGIGVVNGSPSHWWGSSWADYDLDGWLDVVVTRTDGMAVLFHNNSDGTFDEVSRDLDVGVPMEDGKNPVWLDYDDDGDPDLYLGGMWQHRFYRNDGGAFVDITSEVFSPALPVPPAAAGAPVVFAAAAGDFNQDGQEDMYLGRFDLQDVLLLNDGDGGFVQHSLDWGLTTTNGAWSDYGVLFENTMGLGVVDLRDDGYPDVWIGTGNPVRAAADVTFCNSPDHSFDRCTNEIITGADRIWRTRSHGTVSSDFDHDGDTDIAVNLGGHPGFDAQEGDRISREYPALFVNQNGAAGNTATLTLVGTRSNRDAVGARIRVGEAPPHFYTVRSMQGFQSQNSRSQLIVLGDGASSEVEIRWPSGQRQRVELRPGERLTIVER